MTVASQGDGAPLREGECFDEVGGCGVSGFGGAADGVESVADGGDPEAVAAWGEGGQSGPGGDGGGQVVGLDGGGDAGDPFAADDDELAGNDSRAAPLTGCGVGVKAVQRSAFGS